MANNRLLTFFFFTFSFALAGACGGDDSPPPTPDSGVSPITDAGTFFCATAESQACIGNVHWSCERPAGSEFVQSVNEDCAAMDQVCAPDLWCITCRPDSVRCDGITVQQCSSDGSEWVPQEDCDINAGLACRDGRCVDLCDEATSNRSYVGCEFYAVDLDNAGIRVGSDASAQQYAVVVSNPNAIEIEVRVEVNDALFGAEASPRELLSVRVPAGDLEILRLPRREVDGSSSNAVCLPDDRTCPGTEVCVCSSGDTAPPCLCRVTATASGINDGTHTAVTSNAFRISSQLPIIAYQFNPLDNVGVFSNDASLLLPTSAIGRRYTAIAWPQTIANDSINPDNDFDSSRDDEDLRATLTIVGTERETTVNVTYGDRVVKVVGAGAIPEMGPRGSFSMVINPWDVINLETQALNGDFTGTVIDADRPVSVFVGSEASDVPRFDSYATRQCCADHLEEQLWPDQSHGRRFMIARQPRRSVALNNAFLNPLTDSVAETNEPEWVRVLATTAGTTVLNTTLPFPDDVAMLAEGESIIFRADQDFILEADKPVAVLQALPSQEAVGIPSEYPGGDPAIVLVPPVEQYRQDYVFLAPDLYAFDFVTITAKADTRVLLDGEPLDPRVCTTSAADGLMRRPGDPPPTEVIHRCQFSFPDVIGLPNVRVEDGDQSQDGVHTIVADDPVGIVVYGFDAFVSYAYAGGLNLEIIN
ncbi:MAG: hypothetical protein DRJ42_08950 [Deltaproteobacteria bacterium]|nr:MAG: hypothetical protein DRJ42_08950 [Deltaproteobacteria bacterium]